MFMNAIIRYNFILVCAFSIVSAWGCGKGESTVGSILPFDSIPAIKPLQPLVNEISGIADSKQNNGLLWAEEDSGHPPQLYLIDRAAVVVKTVYINGATNRDWEDMTLAGSTLYIAETGDNLLAYTDYLFYSFPEPSKTADTVRDIATIRFRYPDGSHDAEAFLVEASTNQLYIITKQDNPSRIYKLSPPFTSMNTATLVGTLPYTEVVSAAQSDSGREVFVKTYDHLYYYKRSEGESLVQCLQHSFIKQPLQQEPQGEAVCFALDNSGFFTLSEKGWASFVNLHFYKRR